MTGTTILSKVTTTVTLGVAGYLSPLTITSTGEVAPIAAGADAIIRLANGAHGKIVNDGTVAAATGLYGTGEGSGSSGGVGIALLGNAGVINAGLISGGAGGRNTYASGYAGLGGGSGVVFSAGGRLSNSGTIAGGAGQYGPNAAGVGGAGVWATGGMRVVNAGVITGGHGGTPETYAVASGPAAGGGAGVYLASSGSVTNSGTITGGTAAYFATTSGVGVDLAGGGTLFNGGGVIRGGTSGDGVVAAGGASIVNAGQIDGGGGAYGFFSGSDGGCGVLLTDGGTLSNHGTVIGGRAGGYNPESGSQQPGANGAGVILALGGTVTNTGLIEGGYLYGGFFGTAPGATGILSRAGGTLVNNGTIAGGNNGGIGVDLVSGGALTNRGAISGAAGTTVDSFYFGSGGGVGVSLAGAAAAFNGGSIAGGAGGAALYQGGEYIFGGNGGAGVVLSSASTLTNVGSIAGGAGGNGAPYAGLGGIGASVTNAYLINNGAIAGGAGGAGRESQGGGSQGGGSQGGGSDGGAGVYLNGGTLTNAGEISGGLGSGSGPAADAVQFGPVAATLIIHRGAVFNGVVAANPTVDDTLHIAAKTTGTLSGLGSQFTGFTTLTEGWGASWTLAGFNSLGTATDMRDAGLLSVTGSLVDAGRVALAAGGTLLAAGNGSIQIRGATLAGGMLGCSATATCSVGAGLPSDQAGAITVHEGAVVAGFGTIDAARIVDNGNIMAKDGSLDVMGPVSGGGAVVIDSGATLSATAGLTVANVVFRAGGNESLLSGASPITSALSGFGGGDVIDIRPLTATTLTFLAGTLTLLDGSDAVGSLKFEGPYTAANFALASDGQGGTDISFVPSADLGQAAMPSPPPDDTFFPDDPRRGATPAVLWHHSVGTISAGWCDIAETARF